MKPSKTARFACLLLPVAMLGAGTAASAANGDSVLGKWKTETREGVVEIERCGSSICGRLIRSHLLKSDPDVRDVNNKDESKRDRRIKNLQILGGFERDGDKWESGSIYNPQDGGTYKATITPAGPDTLKLKGCIVWPLCKTQTWTRLP